MLRTNTFVRPTDHFRATASLSGNSSHAGDFSAETCDALLAGGSALMPINNCGFSRWFAWVNERLGVSWQLNLS